MIPLRDTIPSRCTPIMTWAIIAANTAIFLFQTSLPAAHLQRLVYLFGLVPARYSHPLWARWIGFPADDWWPFLTYMFLHGNLPHLIGNMWTLWIFGDNVEDRMGPLRFLIFYLLSGVMAGLIQYWLTLQSRVPMIGASGAVAGVLGAYFIMYPRARVIALFPVIFYPIFLEIPAVTYLLVWLLSQLWAGMLESSVAVRIGGGIAWWAHVGGFAFGFLAHPLFLTARRCPRRRGRRDEYGLEGAWKPWV